MDWPLPGPDCSLTEVEFIRAGHEAAPRVAVLLCSFNGARFLAEQLDSILAQNHHDWRLWVSDDGSVDGSLTILEVYRQQQCRGRMEVRKGPRKGFAANFLSLVCAEEIEGDYFAYADQDDVWCPDKLSRALVWLRSVDAGVPALYCSRSSLIDEAGRCVGLSPVPRRSPDIRNALVENIAGGNTMVFNAAARALLVKAGEDVGVHAHDWWTYLVVLAGNGQVHFDPQPTLKYRIHDRNLIGGVRSSLIMRARAAVGGRFKKWIDANMDALARIEGALPERNRRLLEQFREARERGGLAGGLAVMRCGIFRQRRSDTLKLWLALVFHRV